MPAASIDVPQPPQQATGPLHPVIIEEFEVMEIIRVRSAAEAIKLQIV
jgi:hypothetical protein